MHCLYIQTETSTFCTSKLSFLVLITTKAIMPSVCTNSCAFVPIVVRGILLVSFIIFKWSHAITTPIK